MNNKNMPNFDDLTYELDLITSLLDANDDYVDDIGIPVKDSEKVWEYERLRPRITSISYIVREKLSKVSKGIEIMQDIEFKRSKKLNKEG